MEIKQAKKTVQGTTEDNSKDTEDSGGLRISEDQKNKNVNKPKEADLNVSIDSEVELLEYLDVKQGSSEEIDIETDHERKETTEREGEE